MKAYTYDRIMALCLVLILMIKSNAYADISAGKEDLDISFCISLPGMSLEEFLRFSETNKANAMEDLKKAAISKYIVCFDIKDGQLVEISSIKVRENAMIGQYLSEDRIVPIIVQEKHVDGDFDYYGERPWYHINQYPMFSYYNIYRERNTLFLEILDGIERFPYYEKAFEGILSINGVQLIYTDPEPDPTAPLKPNEYNICGIRQQYGEKLDGLYELFLAKYEGVSVVEPDFIHLDSFRYRKGYGNLVRINGNGDIAWLAESEKENGGFEKIKIMDYNTGIITELDVGMPVTAFCWYGNEKLLFCKEQIVPWYGWNTRFCVWEVRESNTFEITVQNNNLDPMIKREPYKDDWYGFQASSMMTIGDMLIVYSYMLPYVLIIDLNTGFSSEIILFNENSNLGSDEHPGVIIRSGKTDDNVVYFTPSAVFGVEPVLLYVSTD